MCIRIFLIPGYRWGPTELLNYHLPCIELGLECERPISYDRDSFPRTVSDGISGFIVERARLYT